MDAAPTCAAIYLLMAFMVLLHPLRFQASAHVTSGGCQTVEVQKMLCCMTRLLKLSDGEVAHLDELHRIAQNLARREGHTHFIACCSVDSRRVSHISRLMYSVVGVVYSWRYFRVFALLI
mmetsp:Transcript_86504/g.209775  ORF Transcript_86504/g.209775 Transcript_86504/m.209775 type:complete len:120 (-) Transcript_86504:3-362(-)